jgi:transglutaminase-like putative cysteine protease
MRLRIRHETVYAYDRVVAYSIQTLHVTPRRTPGSASMPGGRERPPRPSAGHVDAFGNVTHAHVARSRTRAARSSPRA